MPTYRFQEVKLRGAKSGKCSVCGKRRQRSTTFSQTINPFNKNADGVPKTREEILAELNEEARLWKATPLVCASCEKNC